MVVHQLAMLENQQEVKPKSNGKYHGQVLTAQVNFCNQNFP